MNVKFILGKAVTSFGTTLVACVAALVVGPAAFLFFAVAISNIPPPSDIVVSPAVVQGYTVMSCEPVPETGLFRLKLQLEDDQAPVSAISQKEYEPGQVLELLNVTIGSLEGEQIVFPAVRLVE